MVNQSSPRYHNTTQLQGSALADAHACAQRQEDLIADLFREVARPMAPSEVWRRCCDAGHRWPLTSVRRAMTTLTGLTVLVRLDVQVQGIYGKPEHLWALADGQLQLFGRRAA